MKIFHIVPDTDYVSNGMASVARLLVKAQGDAEVVDLNHGMHRIQGSDVEEVWVHGMWLPREWIACWCALRAGKRLVRMTHGSLSPLYLKYQSPFKKWLVGPIERFFLRRSIKIVATCNEEKDWIKTYLGKKCPSIEVIDIKQFFNLQDSEVCALPTDRPLHVLYLGRLHSLKGLECLEEAIEGVKGAELHIVNNAFGDEKDKVWEWCDVLVLPTLSENFGLVVAEALERGKRVIATDGAPAWSDGNDYGGRLVYLRGYRDGTPEERVRLLRNAIEKLTCHC